MGLLSDRYRPPRASWWARCWAGSCMVPLWVYAPSTALLVLGAFLIQFMVQGAWGVIPAHLSELSPDSVRGFLPGFAYQCGVLVASSVVYIEAVFARTAELRHRHGAHRSHRVRAGRDRGRRRQGTQGHGVRRQRMSLLLGWRGLRGIILADPVGVQIRWQAQHANVREAAACKRTIRGPEVGAFHHGTTAAIDHHVGILWQASDRLLQRLNPLRLRRRSSVDGMRDVPATIQHRKRDGQEARSLSPIAPFARARPAAPVRQEPRGRRFPGPSRPGRHRERRGTAKTRRAHLMAHRETS